MLEIFLYTISDFLSLFNILISINIIQTNIKKLSGIKIAIYSSVFLLFSVFFYNYYFIEHDIITFVLLLISYIRYPIITFLITKSSLLICFYISVIFIQSCDSIHILTYNIIEKIISQPNDITKCFILILIRLLITILLLLVHKSKNLNKIKNVLKILPLRIYILIAINILLIGSITSVIGYETANLTAQAISTNVILLLVFSISIIITFSLISNCISKTYYNNINSILEKQIENQIEHYNQTEMLNSDLRRFKHDYTNHILCLKAMINSNQNGEALEYIEKINSEISLSAKNFNTGHKIADAILNEKSRIHSDISIKFDGHIPDFLDNVDLCIILGNAVDNAIEACEKLCDRKKTIDITANFQQSHFILIMRNPVSEELIINGEFPETTKEDSLKHGFGLSNIKLIVDKYEGDMSIGTDNGVFTLYIALKSDDR